MQTPQPKEKPILFSGPMVRAILDGRKTQTRRIVKPQPDFFVPVGRYGAPFPYRWGKSIPDLGGVQVQECIECPYGSLGYGEGRLWVRETWYENVWPSYSSRFDDQGVEVIFYRADGLPDFEGEENGIRWRPSIHMPRWASRISLEITNIRIERLNDISEADAEAEGINVSVTNPWPREPFNAKNYVFAREAFADLWKVINGEESWDANPWVWVIEFRPIKGEL